MYSNQASFSNSMDLGTGDSYSPGDQTRDGSRPASSAWMFAVLIWRI